jgi:hypothetical protein
LSHRTGSLLVDLLATKRKLVDGERRRERDGQEGENQARGNGVTSLFEEVNDHPTSLW